ncbi:hypothetical protein [Pseudochryseolinea flava]|uniref:Lipoprotein n=1 Tax=Pseudochryseolinea flava TaxID=2059302 RepID=A0A364Y1Y2_9BACT|nr:hypothetical protein [Pseudochryseolinea flava]RAW00748.1 hypothetical protein DQQ10_14310 [Pseudochryseolinea flava]
MKNRVFFLLLTLLALVIACSPSTNNPQDNFSFQVNDVFELSSGQLVLSGQIKSGEIKKSEKLKITIDNNATTVTIENMEVFAKPSQTDVGYKDDYAAFTISGLSKSQITKGMIITK